MDKVWRRGVLLFFGWGMWVLGNQERQGLVGRVCYLVAWEDTGGMWPGVRQNKVLAKRPGKRRMRGRVGVAYFFVGGVVCNSRVREWSQGLFLALKREIEEREVASRRGGGGARNAVCAPAGHRVVPGFSVVDSGQERGGREGRARWRKL